MNNINKIIRMASVGAALAVVFTITFATPAFAHASYGSYGGYGYNGGHNQIYSTPSYTFSGGNHNYGYGYHSSPVVISQPEVIVQQPQVVYEQPQVVYEQPQTVVYQQSQPVVYQQPVYQAPAYTYSSYSPLTVTCYANQASVSVGQSVTWQAYVSGGSDSYYGDQYNSGSYTYTWTGTNGSYQTGSTASSIYYTPGSYSVSVTVYGNGQSVTQSCGYVTVAEAYAYAPTPTYTYAYPTSYTQTNSGNLVAACFANRTSAAVGTPVTWAVEVTGGTGQYTYSWSGTDGLSGTGASVTQSYDRTGSKNATVLISSNGQTISQACGDAVSIRSYVSPTEQNYQGPATTNASTTNSTSTNSLSAAALLGLGIIPWGWIAILIIIILGVTVFYLLFNRHKI